jgi:hypothetical protein
MLRGRLKVRSPASRTEVRSAAGTVLFDFHLRFACVESARPALYLSPLQGERSASRPRAENVGCAERIGCLFLPLKGGGSRWGSRAARGAPQEQIRLRAFCQAERLSLTLEQLAPYRRPL